jgi:hypothetical protein
MDDNAMFEHVKLGDVMPPEEALPGNIYTLMVEELGAAKTTPKTGKNAGQEIEVIKARFVVQDPPHGFYVSRLWHTFYPSSSRFREEVAALAYAIGVEWERGETVRAWLKRLEKLGGDRMLRVPVKRKMAHWSPKPVNEILMLRARKVEN